VNILLSHGSPNAQHRQAVGALSLSVGTLLGEPVAAAFLGDALPEGARVVPLFLLYGRHLQVDVPAMIEGRGIEILGAPADDSAAMAGMALELTEQTRGKQRAVMFAFYKLLAGEALMAQIYELGRKFSLPSVAGLHGAANVASVLKLYREEGMKDAYIQPVILFPGHSLDQLEKAANASGLEVQIGPVLSRHPEFALWLANQFRGAA